MEDGDPSDLGYERSLELIKSSREITFKELIGHKLNAKQKDIWKFNDDEWKVHIESSEVCDLLSDKFNIKPSTKYYSY